MKNDAYVSGNTDQNTANVRLNLSQFEGHTPGPWREILDQGPEDLNGWDELQEMGFNDEARDLIAATPLLLEEVKRLQRKLMLAESALGEIRAYYESGQGNLGEIIEHYQENEQVEMPNAFDED